MSQDALLSTKQAAEFLQCDTATVQSLVDGGSLPVHGTGETQRIRTVDVLALRTDLAKRRKQDQSFLASHVDELPLSDQGVSGT